MFFSMETRFFLFQTRVLIAEAALFKDIQVRQFTRYFSRYFKAFDRVYHAGLIIKLRSYGVSGNLLALL